MTRPIILRRIASAEVDEAMAWYKLQKPGLEHEFKQSVDEMLERIAANPLRFHLVRDRVRCALLRRFPYGIHYLPEADAIVVLAVFS